MLGFWCAALAAVIVAPGAVPAAWSGPMEELGRVAASVVRGSRVAPGHRIGDRENTTGYALRVPGATLEYYPAFWVRDAAMMLGGGFVGAAEVEGWVRVIASVQAPAAGRELAHGLSVPPFSIPDHITLNGRPCWFPGAYDGPDQGSGVFGRNPPADDAFYFIGMVREHLRLTGTPAFLASRVTTPDGEVTAAEACARAFGSVDADAKTGLVVCAPEPGATRVDWGFCDTVRKTGSCLFPSLLRWRAALDLSEMHAAAGARAESRRWAAEALRTRRSIARTFLMRPADHAGEAMLLSATGIGRQEDVWGAAFAVWLGALPPADETAVARRLLRLYREGGVVMEGQVRCLPPSGPYGGFWQQCVAARGTYQNGAFWGTPSGWFISALRRVDEAAALQMLGEYLAHIRRNADRGAPFECGDPATDHWQNPRYAASAGLVANAILHDLHTH